MECLIGSLSLEDHPSNPNLQVGKILGKTVVVGRHYDNNVLGIFIPDGAIIPDKLAEEMWLKGKLAGSKKNRVKARDMQGVFSEGLFYGSTYFVFDNGEKKDIISPSWNPNWKVGDDVSKEIGVMADESLIRVKLEKSFEEEIKPVVFATCPPQETESKNIAVIEHFPEDWIAPGEYRFCAAGWHLLPDQTKPCAICGNQPNQEDFELEAQTRKEREELALSRKNSGVPRLFWMIKK